MNGVKVTTSSLRSMVLLNKEGVSVRAGDLIGDDGKAVVIFLRHLG